MYESVCTYSHTNFRSISDRKSCLKHLDTDGKKKINGFKSNSMGGC